MFFVCTGTALFYACVLRRGGNVEAHSCELPNSDRLYRMDPGLLGSPEDRVAAKLSAETTLSCYEARRSDDHFVGSMLLHCTSLMTVLLAACYCTALH